MKKTIISIIAIAFMLLAITACRPNYVFVPFPGGNGGSASSDEYQEIADKVNPATLVNDVLQSGKTGIDVKNSLEKISSKISRAATTRTALDDGNYNLTARVEFTDYPTAAGKITGGVLVYTIPGVVSNGTFTATGSGSVETETALVIAGTTMTIDDDSMAVTITATASEDVTITEASVVVSAPSVSVGGNTVSVNPVVRIDAASVNLEMKEFMKNFIKVNNKFQQDDTVGAEAIAEEMGITAADVFIDLGYFGNVDNVVISGHKYTADSSIIPVSVGMGAFYNDSVYKIDEETENLLVNKAAFMFSLLAGEGISVNGTEYDGYSLFDADPKELTIRNVKVGGVVTEAESDSVYNVEITKKNTMTTYDYEEAPVQSGDTVYVITRDPSTGEVTQNSLLTSSSTYSLYVYFTPWDEEITGNKKWSVTKLGTVFTGKGQLKGTFDVTFNVTTNPSATSET